MTRELTVEFDRLRAALGAQGPPLTGSLDTRSIERFARASGETDPVYYSDDAALAAGFTSRPAPPLMLSSVLDWDGGPALDQLRSDGSGAGKERWLPLDGLRLMGGGQVLAFHRRALAGLTFTATPTLDDVELKHGASGMLLLVSVVTRFHDEYGDLLLTCTETLIGR